LFFVVYDHFIDRLLFDFVAVHGDTHPNYIYRSWRTMIIRKCDPVPAYRQRIPYELDTQQRRV
jgi:hypothetical protein